MISRKHIVVGVATGAVVAIVLGLSVGNQRASVNRTSVASYAHTDHTGRHLHHTMEKCVKIGYRYAESSGKSGKSGYRKERVLQKKNGIRRVSNTHHHHYNSEHGGHSVRYYYSEYGSKGSKGGGYYHIVCKEENSTPAPVTSEPTENPTNDPTENPTNDPTSSPMTAAPVTSEPTENPTMKHYARLLPYPTKDPTSTEAPVPKPIPPEPIISPVSAALTPCGGRKFYLQTTEYPNPNHLGDVVNNKCTNDGYDDDVDNDSYDSADECCTAKFANVEKCMIVDICTPTSEPTVDPTPAPVISEPTENPTMKHYAQLLPYPTKDPTSSPMTAAPTPCESRIIFIVTVNEETICSNGYYESVDSEDFFNNFDYCCDMLVADGNVDAVDKCKREDICNPTEAPTALLSRLSQPRTLL